MSYNQPKTKEFVKAKPLKQTKEKPTYQREPKKINKKYEQKSNQLIKDPRQHIKIVLSQYKNYDRSPLLIQLCSKFPRYFCQKTQKFQPQNQLNYGQFIWLGNKKQPLIRQAAKQMSSDSSDPNWESDQQKQVKLISKKIDENVISKVNNTINRKQPNKKLNDLQRHEREFLEQYYRQKRHQQHQPHNTVEQKTVKTQKEEKEEKSQKANKKQQGIKKQEQQDEWAQYDPNVGALITKGFIEKIQQGQDGDFDEDFSYQSEKSKKSSSSDEQDDMFADEGPRTIVKTKQDKNEGEKSNSNKQVVTISSHIFTQIAQQVGVHPQTCVWIISNKQERYKVSTLYMNQYYKNSGLCGAFPFVSLNNSQFVHNQQIQTEKGLARFKQQGQRRRKIQSNFNKNSTNPNQKHHNSHYKQKKLNEIIFI